MSKFLIIYLILLFYSNISNASDMFQCETHDQSGFQFIGKDIDEILKYLGLKKFTLKLSRNRKEIIENQRKELPHNNQVKNLKNVHFLELILITTKKYPTIFHCSWRHKIDLNKIYENNFECIEQLEKNDLFSIDFEGNFSYSSSFNLEKKKNKKIKTLHSIFGKCSLIKK